MREMPERTAIEGEAIYITCAVGGYPIHQVTWSRGMYECTRSKWSPGVEVRNTPDSPGHLESRYGCHLESRYGCHLESRYGYTRSTWSPNQYAQPLPPCSNVPLQPAVRRPVTVAVVYIRCCPTSIPLRRAAASRHAELT